MPIDLQADARLEHLHHHADRVIRAGRRSPIPRYADSTDAEFRTTAISEVT